jgi:hypothetical protein
VSWAKEKPSSRRISVVYLVPLLPVADIKSGHFATVFSSQLGENYMETKCFKRRSNKSNLSKGDAIIAGDLKRTKKRCTVDRAFACKRRRKKLPPLTETRFNAGGVVEPCVGSGTDLILFRTVEKRQPWRFRPTSGVRNQSLS